MVGRREVRPRRWRRPHLVGRVGQRERRVRRRPRPGRHPGRQLHRRGSRIRIDLWRDHRELVGRQDVAAVLDRCADRHGGSAPRIAADRHVALGIAAQLDGGRTLARELLARIVARPAHHTGIVLRCLAVHVGRQFTQRRVGRGPDLGGRDEAHRARRRIPQVDLEVQLAALVRRQPGADGVQRGEQGREDDERVLQRLAVDDADATEVGQIGGQHRERRPDTRERLVGHLGGTGHGLQRGPQLRVGVGDLGGQPGQPVGHRADVVAAAQLRFQERARLVDQ